MSYKELCNAVYLNDTNAVKFLLGRLAIYCNDPQDYSKYYMQCALNMACRKSNLHIVRMLITASPISADPNIRQMPDEESITPVEYAMYSNDMELFKVLSRESLAPVKLNYTMGNSTPLGWAIQQNNLPLVQMMLQAGANPKFLLVCIKHIEPLKLAMSQENWAMCKMLLDYGCELPMNVINDAASLGREDVQLFINHAIEKGNGVLLQHLLHNIYKKSGDSVKDLGWNEAFLENALRGNTLNRNCLQILLDWGMYTSPWSEILFNPSVLRIAAVCGQIYAVKMLVEHKPQSLQESWLVNGNIPHILAYCSSFTEEHIEARQQPLLLKHLCRAKIYQQLGYNAVEKAYRLPLPRILKEFVQFKKNTPSGLRHLYSSCG